MEETIIPKEIEFPVRMINGDPYTLDGKRMLAPGTRSYCYYWRDNFELSREEVNYIIDKMMSLEKHYNAMRDAIYVMTKQLQNADALKEKGILP